MYKDTLATGTTEAREAFQNRKGHGQQLEGKGRGHRERTDLTHSEEAIWLKWDGGEQRRRLVYQDSGFSLRG